MFAQMKKGVPSEESSSSTSVRNRSMSLQVGNATTESPPAKPVVQHIDIKPLAPSPSLSSTSKAFKGKAENTRHSMTAAPKSKKDSTLAPYSFLTARTSVGNTLDIGSNGSVYDDGRPNLSHLLNLDEKELENQTPFLNKNFINTDLSSFFVDLKQEKEKKKERQRKLAEKKKMTTISGSEQAPSPTQEDNEVASPKEDQKKKLQREILLTVFSAIHDKYHNTTPEELSQGFKSKKLQIMKYIHFDDLFQICSYLVKENDQLKKKKRDLTNQLEEFNNKKTKKKQLFDSMENGPTEDEIANLKKTVYQLQEDIRNFVPKGEQDMSSALAPIHLVRKIAEVSKEDQDAESMTQFYVRVVSEKFRLLETFIYYLKKKINTLEEHISGGGESGDFGKFSGPYSPKRSNTRKTFSSTENSGSPEKAREPGSSFGSQTNVNNVNSHVGGPQIDALYDETMRLRKEVENYRWTEQKYNTHYLLTREHLKNTDLNYLKAVVYALQNELFHATEALKYYNFEENSALKVSVELNPAAIKSPKGKLDIKKPVLTPENSISAPFNAAEESAKIQKLVDNVFGTEKIDEVQKLIKKRNQNSFDEMDTSDDYNYYMFSSLMEEIEKPIPHAKIPSANSINPTSNISTASISGANPSIPSVNYNNFSRNVTTTTPIATSSSTPSVPSSPSTPKSGSQRPHVPIVQVVLPSSPNLQKFGQEAPQNSANPTQSARNHFSNSMTIKEIHSPVPSSVFTPTAMNKEGSNYPALVNELEEYELKVMSLQQKLKQYEIEIDHLTKKSSRFEIQTIQWKKAIDMLKSADKGGYQVKEFELSLRKLAQQLSAANFYLHKKENDFNIQQQQVEALSSERNLLRKENAGLTSKILLTREVLKNLKANFTELNKSNKVLKSAALTLTNALLEVSTSNSKDSKTSVESQAKTLTKGMYRTFLEQFRKTYRGAVALQKVYRSYSTRKYLRKESFPLKCWEKKRNAMLAKKNSSKKSIAGGSNNTSNTSLLGKNPSSVLSTPKPDKTSGTPPPILQNLQKIKEINTVRHNNESNKPICPQFDAVSWILQITDNVDKDAKQLVKLKSIIDMIKLGLTDWLRTNVEKEMQNMKKELDEKYLKIIESMKEVLKPKEIFVRSTQTQPIVTKEIQIQCGTTGVDSKVVLS